MVWLERRDMTGTHAMVAVIGAIRGGGMIVRIVRGLRSILLLVRTDDRAIFHAWYRPLDHIEEREEDTEDDMEI